MRCGKTSHVQLLRAPATINSDTPTTASKDAVSKAYSAGATLSAPPHGRRASARGVLAL